MMTMDGKEQQTMGATHSQLYRELLATQNKLAEQVEWVKHVFGEDRKAVAAALARAEAAEAERDSANIEAALEQANAAEAWARVAELEAQLAAQQWRPVTEKPAHAGYYLCATRDPMVPMHVVWHTPDGAWYVLPDERVLTHWRPLPPPPDAATMEEQP